jgi:hypothetical protein
MNIDKILNDLQDLIIVLHDKNKCENKDFQKIWSIKMKNCRSVIESLSEDDYNELDSLYERWFNKYMEDINK